MRFQLLASKQKTSKLPGSKKVNEPTHSLQRDLSETIVLKLAKKKKEAMPLVVISIAIR